uniref:Anoctamin dimerisation domain-containing protein n=1 Tax=Acrobeloides nanus TaxID=290746 RepID=A0A914BUI7_9BILA
MTESSVGANPDSMIMFDDVSDVNRQSIRTRTNRSFSQSEKEKLLRTNSLNMPHANKISNFASSHFGTPRRRKEPENSFDSNVELVNVSGLSSPVVPVIQPSSNSIVEAPAQEEILPESPENPNETHIPRIMRFDSLIAPGTIENGDLPTKAAKVETPESQYFKDGKRLVDYVLAYEEGEDDDEGSDYDDDESSSSQSTAMASSHKPSMSFAEAGILSDVLNKAQTTHTKKTKKFKKIDKRAIFEGNLRRLGLELEYASARHSRTKFILIHAPFQVLTKQAELMRIKMPVHQNDIKKNATLMDGLLNRFLQRFKFLEFNDETKRRTEMQDYFTQPFMEQHLDCFVNHDDEENFFPRTERSRMVYDFLIRTRYDRGKTTKFRVGIQRLLYNRTYTSAFPLHEEIEYYPTKEKPIDLSTCSDRQFLYETWVKVKNFYKYQPLHLIQKYFGTQMPEGMSGWLGLSRQA